MAKKKPRKPEKRKKEKKEKKQSDDGGAEEAADAKDATDAAFNAKAGKKLDLLKETGAADAQETGAADAQETLEISESYANKYNRRKGREELERATRILADEDSGSTETDEDEEAELLTDKVEGKIFETLNKIKSRDPTIYDKGHVFFKDNDFDKDKASSSSSKESKKRMTYGDQLRETLLKEGAEAFAQEDAKWEAGPKAEKMPVDEQKELRSDIIAAAHGGEDEDDDDNLFEIKDKSKDELKHESESFADFDLKKSKERPKEDIITRYWKADEDLGQSERFLRDYILNKAWMETTSLQATEKEGSGSEEDEHLEEVDEFEKDYNFRFEMDGAQQVQGHKRFQENSVRERPDKRKRQRQERKERKESEKVQRTEELKRLKNLKKQEIMRRLKQLQHVTGNDELPLDGINLDADFDPDSYDKDMGKVFNEDYDQGEEQLDGQDLVAAPQGCEDLDVSSAATEVMKRHRKSGAASSKSAAQDEDAAGEGEWEEGDEEDEAAADPEVWWLCDDCGQGIPGGKRRFDCEVCENYTLCAKCFRNRKHPHKFVRRRVPGRNAPPQQVEGEEDAGVNASDPQEDKMEKLLDEHFQLDYEDIIGGDLPTRFSYRKVAPDNFGLTAADILSKTDKELNHVFPLKKITRAYRGTDADDRDEGHWKPVEWIKKRGGKKETRGPNNLSAGRLDAYNFELDNKRDFKKVLKKHAEKRK